MPDARLAIAHVTPYPWGAGHHEITCYVERATAVLAARGHQVLIIAPSRSSEAVRETRQALKLCRWISQAIVFGDRRPYLTALLTIDPDEAGALAEKVGASSKKPADLAKDQAVRKELQGAVDDANRKFARIEQVKKFTILERDLSQDDDELTPTLKVKRNVVYESYKDVFKAMYDAGDERPKSAPPAKPKS